MSETKASDCRRLLALLFPPKDATATAPCMDLEQTPAEEIAELRAMAIDAEFRVDRARRHTKEALRWARIYRNEARAWCLASIFFALIAFGLWCCVCRGI